MTKFRHFVRYSERGTAIILVLVMMGALLVGGAIGLSTVMYSMRSSGTAGAALRHRYCAEAGLAAGRVFFTANKPSWNTWIVNGFQLTGQAEPGGTGPTYTVRLEDNVDEFPPATNQPLIDSDGKVVMVSVCAAGTADVQEARQVLLSGPLGQTGFVYKSSDDTSQSLPVTIGGTATLAGNATLGLVGAGAPRGLAADAQTLQLFGGGGGAQFINAEDLNGTRALEVTLWFRAATTQAAYSTLLSKSHGGASGNRGWTVEFDAAGRYLQFGVHTDNQTGGVSAFSTTPMNDDKWHHLVGRYDGQRVSLYIDGVLQRWTPASGNVRANDGVLTVGYWLAGPSRYYTGFLSEITVRSWDTPIYYPFDGGMAIHFGTTTDLSGTQLIFSGANSRAQVLNSPEVSGQEGLEVDFWFLADPSQPAYADILSKSHGAAAGDTGWNVEFLSTTGRLGFGVYTTGGGGSVTSLRAVTDNQWHRFRGVYDGRYLTLFIDDVLQGQQVVTGDIKINDKVLTVGAWEVGPSRFFRGRLRDLRVRSFNAEVEGYQDGLVILDDRVVRSVGHDGRAPALTFNGANAQAAIPDSFTAMDRRPLAGPTGVEVALWMRAHPTQQAHATVISKSHGAASGNTGWTMEFDSTGKRLGYHVFTTAGLGSTTSPMNLNDNLWHEIKGVYDGRYVSLYVDRVLRSQAPLSGPMLDNPKPATVGYWEYGPSRHFRGDIDSLRVNPLYTAGDPETTDRFMVQTFRPWAGYGILSGSWLQGDLNGDRMDDLFHICCGNYMHTWTAQGDGNYNVSTFSPGAGYGMQLGQWLTGDIDGDGETDLFHICCGNYIHPWISRGDGTYDVKYFSPGPGYGVQLGQWKAGDFNGDGKTDLAHICCSNYIHLWLSNGDGTFTVTYFSPGPGYGVQLGTWQAADFNGDGKTDLAHICCTNYVHVWLSYGDGNFNVTYFSPGAGYGVQLGTWLVGDFNGDEKADLLHRCCTNYVHPWLSRGDGTFDVRYYSPSGTYNIQNGEFQVGDLNEDGRDDVVHVVYGTSYVHQWISRGDGTYDLGYFSPGAGYGIPNGRFMLLDTNRDRKLDLLHLVASDYVHPWLSLN